MTYPLITTANHKTIKGEAKGYLTGILYLAPGNIACKSFNVCSFATKGCSKSCLYKAGRGSFTSVQKSRIRKTRELVKNKKKFIQHLYADIKRLARRAESKHMTITFRLNGTSDIPWESKTYGRIPQHFPDIQFYDYTKNIRRVLNKNRPNNYYLTYSRTENNEANCLKVLAYGGNVAAVFDEVPVGKRFWGYKVVDGDTNDLRFLNKARTIIGVAAKGPAKKDTTGFVVRLNK